MTKKKRRRLPPCPDCGARFVDRKLRHEETCPAGNGLDAVTQDDARYFEAHPDHMLRVRPISHAEILEWAHINGVRVDAGARICVHNVTPGFRVRSVIPNRMQAGGA
jgi:hypothetical protein